MNNKQKKALLITALFNAVIVAALTIATPFIEDDVLYNHLFDDVIFLIMVSCILAIFISLPEKKKKQEDKHERSNYWRNMYMGK